jgi:hypothetical protein
MEPVPEDRSIRVDSGDHSKNVITAMEPVVEDWGVGETPSS